MDKTTQSRIEADARKAALVIEYVEYDSGPASSARMQSTSRVDPIQKEFYIKGATAENNRVQPAIDTLEKIVNSPVPANEREMAEWIATTRMLTIAALQQWKGEKEQFTGSTFTSPAPGITLGCISPEARELLDTIMEEWEKHYAGMKEMHGDAMPETTFYGFAYWLVRWSGLIQPANTNPTK